MQYTVYADVLFLVNWLMDYVLLKAAAAVLRLKAGRIRMALAAALGAAWVCVIAVIRLPRAAEAVGSLAVVSSLMIRIAFCPKGVRTFLRQLLTLYGIAIAGGGMVNLIYFHTPAGYYLKNLVQGQASLNPKPAAVIAVSGAAVFAASRMIRKLTDYRHLGSELYTAVLYVKGRSVSLTGLLDTGNRLREPATGKAVHIAQRAALEPLEPDREELFGFLVPYRSVGTEAGILTAVRLDRMDLISAKGEKITLDNPLVGIYEGKLSADNTYQLILHAEIETRQGETL